MMIYKNFVLVTFFTHLMESIRANFEEGQHVVLWVNTVLHLRRTFLVVG